MEDLVLGIDPSTSAVLVEARSNAGAITFGSAGVSGELRTQIIGDRVDPNGPLAATLIVPVASLQSGQSLYDSELRTRLSAKRFPTITAELSGANPLGSDRYAVAGNLTLHGTTRPQTCTVSVDVTEPAPPKVVVTGTTIIDIRDYDIALPNVLLLQIFPDVTVRFRLTAVSDSAKSHGGD